MIFAETFFDFETILVPEWWEWVVDEVMHNIWVTDTLIILVAGYALYQMVDAYLTAFHRKSGARLMYDGEPEEWRWYWPKEK